MVRPQQSPHLLAEEVSGTWDPLTQGLHWPESQEHERHLPTIVGINQTWDSAITKMTKSKTHGLGPSVHEVHGNAMFGICENAQRELRFSGR